MAIFRPFPAVRPDSKLAAEVLCPPYDVVSRKEAAEISAASPNSLMHVIRPDGDLIDEPEYSDRMYNYSAEVLQRFIDNGVLYEEASPVYFIYSQTMNGRTQTGITGCASIDDYDAGVIKRHEITREEKEKDRIRHFDTCNADTEPVFLIYRNNAVISELTSRIMAASLPDYETTDAQGVNHKLWTISDAADIKALLECFADMPALYIADGHHRTASAVKVGAKRRNEHPDYTGEEEFNYFMAVAFPDDELEVLDYNRLVHDLNGLSRDAFLEKLAEIFIVNEISDATPVPLKKHECTMYLDSIWYRLTFRDGIFSSDDPVDSLDVSALQRLVLGPVLGISDPRTDERISFAGGTTDTAGLAAIVDGGSMKVAFRMFPVSVQDIINVADAGLTMPPKSTWFEPKISSGWFIHKL